MSTNEEIVSSINDLTDEIKGLKEEIANMNIRDLTHAIDMLATKLEDFGDGPKKR